MEEELPPYLEVAPAQRCPMNEWLNLTPLDKRSKQGSTHLCLMLNYALSSWLTCFLIPYSLILCFSDMCAAWFSVDCYAAIHERKYPGYSLANEVRLCLHRLTDLLANHQQKTYTFQKMWPSLVIGSILRELSCTSITRHAQIRVGRTMEDNGPPDSGYGPEHLLLGQQRHGYEKRIREPAAVAIDNMFKK